jgi:hypothetical protein
MQGEPNRAVGLYKAAFRIWPQLQNGSGVLLVMFSLTSYMFTSVIQIVNNGPMQRWSSLLRGSDHYKFLYYTQNTMQRAPCDSIHGLLRRCYVDKDFIVSHVIGMSDSKKYDPPADLDVDAGASDSAGTREAAEAAPSLPNERGDVVPKPPAHVPNPVLPQGLAIPVAKSDRHVKIVLPKVPNAPK